MLLLKNLKNKLFDTIDFVKVFDIYDNSKKNLEQNSFNFNFLNFISKKFSFSFIKKAPHFLCRRWAEKLILSCLDLLRSFLIYENILNI